MYVKLLVLRKAKAFKVCRIIVHILTSSISSPKFVPQLLTNLRPYMSKNFLKNICIIWARASIWENLMSKFSISNCAWLWKSYPIFNSRICYCHLYKLYLIFNSIIYYCVFFRSHTQFVPLESIIWLLRKLYPIFNSKSYYYFLFESHT